MFERYTEKSRRIIFFARYEASQYGSREIGTEHLLLGLLRECRGSLGRWFPGQSGVDAQIRSEIEERITIAGRIPTSVEMPLSEEGRNVLKLAGETADRLGHQPIEPEHLLIGMLRVETCLAAQILSARAVKAETIQEHLVKKPHEKYDSSSVPPLVQLNHFLEGIKSQNAGNVMEVFGDEAEFIDASGKRWTVEEVEKGYQTVFAGYAKRNAAYVVEGALAQTNEVFIATVLWKNALMASEERNWMHRMTLVFVIEANEWKIILAQVTPVQPFSAAVK